MRVSLLQFGVACLYGAAGFCLFLMLLNRVLILLPDSRLKTPLVLFAFIVLVGMGFVVGFFLTRPPWVFVPLLVLVLVVCGEGRRIFIRHACAGSRPVDTTPHRIQLAAPITTTDLVIHRYEVSHPKWHGEPLRIVHLTDMHVHPVFPIEYYQAVVAAAEQMNPDIAVFTGDFITTVDALPRLRDVLRPIARLETYAVLGNHDYWADADGVRAVIEECGLSLLADESRALPVGAHELVITGYDYPWGSKESSFVPATDDRLHLVLSHTPDNIYRLAAASADLVFSGHYHAGQFRAPLLGSIVVPSVYGRRFDHGHFVVDGTHLFVASGIGAANPPVRIYCQPDIFVVDIVPAESES